MFMPRQDGVDPRYSRAAAHTIALLQAFEPGDSFLGVLEIAKRIGVPKSTVSRLAYTLAQVGCLRHSQELDKYQLGPGVLSLGRTMLANNAKFAEARTLLGGLVSKSNFFAVFGEVDRLDVVVIDYALGRRAPRRARYAGSRLSIAHNSVGWASIAMMSEERRQGVLRQIREAYPDEWPRLLAKLNRAVAEVWESGFCVTAPSMDITHNAAAAAFSSADGSCVYSIAIAGPVLLLPEKKLRTQWGPRLANTAQRLQRMFGATVTASHSAVR